MSIIQSTRKPSTAVATVSARAAELEAERAYAVMVAQAGDALPGSYRQKPGAVILAVEWARIRGLDPLTAIMNVSFINGRAVVDAKMQRALAVRAGYDVRVTEASSERATVEVWREGTLRGSATFTIKDAERAGLLGKDNWRKHPVNMLVARASTQALGFYAPEVVVGLATPDEVVEDVVEVLTPHEDVVEVLEEELEIAEVVQLPTMEEQTTDLEALKQLLKDHGWRQADAIQWCAAAAREDGTEPPANLQAVVDDKDMLRRLIAQITTQDAS